MGGGLARPVELSAPYSMMPRCRPEAGRFAIFRFSSGAIEAIHIGSNMIHAQVSENEDSMGPTAELIRISFSSPSGFEAGVGLMWV